MSRGQSAIGSAIIFVFALNIVTASATAQELTTSSSTSHMAQQMSRTDGASCGGTLITQNTNPNVITSGTVACSGTGGGPTRENAYARSYFISEAITIECVEFAVETNVGGAWPTRVRLYNDTNGGAPNIANLVQLGPEIYVSIPGGAANSFFTATFPGGVVVPANTTLVVELFQACRTTVSSATCPPGGDGGRLFLGSNNLGQSAPTYIKAPGCNINDFVTLASINFANVHIIQVLGTDSSADDCGFNLPLCNSDIAGGPDGVTNVIDLLKVIETWGQNGQPKGPRPEGDCAPLPQGDCVVTVLDFLSVIDNWGPCPTSP